jgi:hypothetical protein
MRWRHGAWEPRPDAGLGSDVRALVLPSNAQERASVRPSVRTPLSGLVRTRPTSLLTLCVCHLFS